MFWEVFSVIRGYGDVGIGGGFSGGGVIGFFKLGFVGY